MNSSALQSPAARLLASSSRHVYQDLKSAWEAYFKEEKLHSENAAMLALAKDLREALIKKLEKEGALYRFNSAPPQPLAGPTSGSLFSAVVGGIYKFVVQTISGEPGADSFTYRAEPALWESLFAGILNQADLLQYFQVSSHILNSSLMTYRIKSEKDLKFVLTEQCLNQSLIIPRKKTEYFGGSFIVDFNIASCELSFNKSIQGEYYSLQNDPERFSMDFYRGKNIQMTEKIFSRFLRNNVQDFSNCLLAKFDFSKAVGNHKPFLKNATLVQVTVRVRDLLYLFSEGIDLVASRLIYQTTENDMLILQKAIQENPKIDPLKLLYFTHKVLHNAHLAIGIMKNGANPYLPFEDGHSFFDKSKSCQTCQSVLKVVLLYTLQSRNVSHARALMPHMTTEQVNAIDTMNHHTHALTYAIQLNEADLIAGMIEKGADPFKLDIPSQRRLLECLTTPQYRYLFANIVSGIDHRPNQYTQADMTHFFFLAVIANFTESAILLLNHQPLLNLFENSTGYRAIDFAVLNDNAVLIEEIYRAKRLPLFLGSSQGSTFELAIQHRRYEAISSLYSLLPEEAYFYLTSLIKKYGLPKGESPSERRYQFVFIYLEILFSIFEMSQKKGFLQLFVDKHSDIQLVEAKLRTAFDHFIKDKDRFHLSDTLKYIIVRMTDTPFINNKDLKNKIRDLLALSDLYLSEDLVGVNRFSNVTDRILPYVQVIESKISLITPPAVHITCLHLKLTNYDLVSKASLNSETKLTVPASQHLSNPSLNAKPLPVQKRPVPDAKQVSVRSHSQASNNTAARQVNRLQAPTYGGMYVPGRKALATDYHSYFDQQYQSSRHDAGINLMMASMNL